MAIQESSVILRSHGHHAKHTTGTLRIHHFDFECGRQLPFVDIAFETWGRLNTSRSNVIFVCHALTGNAHAGPDGGWWDKLIGPELAIDTNEYYVVASHVLGGCYGSTGPSSTAPDGKPYALRFPILTIRDMVRAQIALQHALGVEQIELVIGGSLGGMQAWEWPLLAPKVVKRVVIVAAQSAFTALGIGYNETMRRSIMSDPDWQNGDYYGSSKCPRQGLAVARSIGMLTYRSEKLFDARFGRRSATDAGAHSSMSKTPFESFQNPAFDVESYLQYQGQKLVERFDANSYLYLTKAMDLHDIGVGRGGVESALSGYSADLTVVGVDSDYLYSIDVLQENVRVAQRAGVKAEYLQLDSIYGHDAFLADQQKLGKLIFADGVK